MLSLSGIPFLRFAFAFISGILVYIFFQPAIEFSIYTSLSFFIYMLLFGVQKLKKEHFYSLKPWLGLSAMATLFLFGSNYAYINDEHNHLDHLLNQKNKCKAYEAIITSIPEKRAKSYKIEAKITRLFFDDSTHATNTKVIVYVSQKNYDSTLQYGDKLLIKGMPQLVAPALNPFEFNYKTYLKYQHIYHTHYLPYGSFLKTGSNEGNPIIKFAFFLRKRADLILHQRITGKTEQDIASALLLGLRGTMDEEIKEIYSATGTTHVLAVSGLHVAIVFQLLLWFFYFLKSTKFSKTILPIFLLVILWLYVLITGFCPSILRAGVMFSLMVIGKIINRNANLYNILFVSVLALLCYDPYMIMDVGFQLSYLALLGICYFTDKIYSMIECSNWILDKLWMSFSISIAAQITTIPITLFYFHQVPLSFLVSNLIAIPLSNGVLYLGILLLMTSPILPISNFLGLLIEWIIKILNYSLYIISKIPLSLVDNIQFNLFQLILLYSILISYIVFIKLKKFSWFLYVSAIVLLFIASFIFQEITNKEQRRVIVYSIKGHHAMAFINGTKSLLVTDPLLAQNNDKIKRHILPSITAYGIDSIAINNPTSWIAYTTNPGFDIYLFQGKSFLFIKNNQSITGMPICDYSIPNFSNSKKHSNKNFNQKSKEMALDISLE